MLLHSSRVKFEQDLKSRSHNTDWKSRLYLRFIVVVNTFVIYKDPGGSWLDLTKGLWGTFGLLKSKGDLTLSPAQGSSKLYCIADKMTSNFLPPFDTGRPLLVLPVCHYKISFKRLNPRTPNHSPSIILNTRMSGQIALFFLALAKSYWGTFVDTLNFQSHLYCLRYFLWYEIYKIQYNSWFTIKFDSCSYL